MKYALKIKKKINSDCEKKIILLMVPNEEKGGWHYLAIKKLSAFLRETSSKNKLIEIFIV